MKALIKKICSVWLAVCIVFCLCSASVINSSATSDDTKYEYKEYFQEYYTLYFEDRGKEFFTDYDELYEYYANKTTSDESTPDLVLSYCSYAYEFALGYSIFENYIFYSAYNYPYSRGLYVLTLNDGKIYTLTEAYDANIDGICDMLEEIYLSGGNLGGWVHMYRVGDVDYDYKITVKDATLIQKYVAKIVTLKDEKIPCGEENMRGYEWKDLEAKHPYYIYLPDFNHDSKINIKDATAIQKYIAGIEY